MKSMKIAAAIVGLGLISTGSIYAEDMGSTSELKLSGSYVAPAEKQWDSGFGGELQYIMWMSPRFGFGLSGGAEQWKTAQEAQTVGGNTATAVDGSAAFYPVGPSALFRFPLASDVSMTFEGGFRYVIASSGVHEHFTSSQTDQFGDLGVMAQGNSDVSLDNVLIGKASAELSFKVSEETTFSIGAGYDFDIIKGDAHGFGQNLGTYSLDAFFARIGIAIRI